jgi:hypothetical protein
MKLFNLYKVNYYFSVNWNFIFLSASLFFSFQLMSQIDFHSSTSFPLNLNTGTDYSSCTSSGSKSMVFDVSGIGIISEVNTLVEIEIQLDASCGGNFRDLGFYLKSPDGMCKRVYNGSSMGTSFSGLHTITLREGFCLNSPNSSNYPSTSSVDKYSSGQYGIFSAGNEPLNLLILNETFSPDPSWVSVTQTNNGIWNRESSGGNPDARARFVAASNASSSISRAWYYSEVYLEAGKVYRTTFEHRVTNGGSETSGNRLLLAYGEPATLPDATNDIVATPSNPYGTIVSNFNTGFTGLSWTQVTASDFTPTQTGNYILAFGAASTVDNRHISIDNIIITDVTNYNLNSAFSGQDANGIWTLYAFAPGSSPCVNSAVIKFGNPLLSDRTADGNNCTDPIIFDGNPICASTNGKTGNVAEPGSITGPGGTSYTASIGGVSCEWNGRNDNNVWIRFSPDSGPACIGISGLNNSLQSIVVSAVDNDVPCPSVGASGANDTRWNLESCPRNAIYGSTAGSQRNQYHCFDAVAGRIYYLVVDGNGGAESPFYVTGTNINSVLLPVELLYFSGRNENNLNLLEWSTATEINNDYFEVLKSTDGRFFEKIGEVKGHGNSTDKKTYSFKDYEVQDKTNYYRLRQVDFDGKSEFSKIVSVSSKSINSIWTIYPNPAKHILRINSDFSAIKEYTIFNTLGMRVQRGAMNSSEKSIDISSLSLGIYFLKIDNQVERFVVEK